MPTLLQHPGSGTRTPVQEAAHTLFGAKICCSRPSSECCGQVSAFQALLKFGNNGPSCGQQHISALFKALLVQNLYPEAMPSSQHTSGQASIVPIHQVPKHTLKL